MLGAPVTALFTQAAMLGTVSIGFGAGADIQYLFGFDILGEQGRKSRHARAWDAFASEYDRLHNRRKAAFAPFRQEVLAGTYPALSELVAMSADEQTRFADWVAGQGPRS